MRSSAGGVVELVRAGRPVRVVAVELGLAEATVYRWKAQDLVDHGIKAGLSTSERGELAAARRRIREFETELALVKQAAALFEEGVRPKAKYPVIAELASQGFSAKRCCRILGGACEPTRRPRPGLHRPTLPAPQPTSPLANPSPPAGPSLHTLDRARPHGCKDSSRQHSADGSPLSCKQQVGGSSPPASSKCAWQPYPDQSWQHKGTYGHSGVCSSRRRRAPPSVALFIRRSPAA